MTRYAPRALGQPGRRLWRSVHAKYDELSIGEELLLVEAARTADLIERLHAAADKPGCPRSTMVELRAQRATLAKLVDQLKI
ncbi:hypothetical protein [Mycolicibacterium hodleri]|uniref:Uncharacterized protein n=1 Tax=Mycolicibacterium hodleri TaxID=49897 RepID=A0A502E4F5_9MYCO|nr:hypothetical protein [Mycolicibacterium hodleri]TPG31662.1 hypothetical protein EAH80_22165 [Mycolicibacterium hodleri]